MIFLEQIFDRLKAGIIEAGQFIREEAYEFTAEKIEKKGFNDLVSYVDKEAEKMLVHSCKDALPEAGFITEEGTENDRKEVYNWIIDPLDGTTNFSHGLPIYSISVALMRGDEIIMGVVYEINRDEFYYALEGKPAFCNEEKIHVSETNSLSESLLATGFPYYSFDKMPKYLNILNDFMQSTHGLRRMGSAAVDLAYVACGRFDGFFEYNLNAWDVAAGAFIVKQAGGEVTDFSGGNDYIFGREIVAGCSIQKNMIEVISKHWK